MLIALLLVTLLLIALLLVALLLVALLLGIGGFLSFAFSLFGGSGLGGFDGVVESLLHVLVVLGIFGEFLVLLVHLALDGLKFFLSLAERVGGVLHILLGALHLAFCDLLGSFRGLFRGLVFVGLRVFDRLGGLVLVVLDGTGLLLDFAGEFAHAVGLLAYVVGEFLLLFGEGGALLVGLGAVGLFLEGFLALFELLGLLLHLLGGLLLRVEVLVELLLEVLGELLRQLLFAPGEFLGVDFVVLEHLGERLLAFGVVLEFLEVFRGLGERVEALARREKRVDAVLHALHGALAGRGLLLTARLEVDILDLLARGGEVFLQDGTEELRAGLEAAVHEILDERREEAFGGGHVALGPAEVLLRVLEMPVVLRDAVAALRAVEAVLGGLELLADVVEFGLALGDLLGERLARERGVLGDEGDSDFGRIGDTRAVHGRG